jgi:hypothetical protein
MASGVLTLTAKTIYLAKAGPAATQTLDYHLEGLSIFTNIAATCVGMFLGSTFLGVSIEEQQRAKTFFRLIDTPITQEESLVTKAQSNSSDNIIRLSTLAVGVLLIVSGALAQEPAAHWIDSSIGIVFLFLGLPIRRMIARSGGRKT